MACGRATTERSCTLCSMSTCIRLAVVGFGNMGEAVVAGALRAGLLVPADIAVVESDPAKLDAARRLGCQASDELSLALQAPEILLAVKPQSFPDIGRELGALKRRTTFISIMAGLSGARIRSMVGGSLAHAVVRAMPNTPCRIGRGMTAIALSDGARPGDDALATALFSAVGQTVRVDERMLDAVTSTSGSGPAYLFLVAEAWEEAAIALGFDHATARQLVRQTIVGAAAMLQDTTVNAADLRAAVTSKGGTTAAAIAVFEDRKFREIMRDALAAAARRGRELGA